MLEEPNGSKACVLTEPFPATILRMRSRDSITRNFSVQDTDINRNESVKWNVELDRETYNLTAEVSERERHVLMGRNFF